MNRAMFDTPAGPVVAHKIADGDWLFSIGLMTCKWNATDGLRMVDRLADDLDLEPLPVNHLDAAVWFAAGCAFVVHGLRQNILETFLEGEAGSDDGNGAGEP